MDLNARDDSGSGERRHGCTGKSVFTMTSRTRNTNCDRGSDNDNWKAVEIQGRERHVVRPEPPRSRKSAHELH